MRAYYGWACENEAKKQTNCQYVFKIDAVECLGEARTYGVCEVEYGGRSHLVLEREMRASESSYRLMMMIRIGMERLG